MDSNEPILQALSPSEWLLLKCIYALGSGTAFDVCEEMRRRYLVIRSPSTIGILLARVAGKGYLEVTANRQSRGRPIHEYRALVPRERALSRVLEGIFEDYALTEDELLKSVATLLEQRRAEKP